MKLEQMIAVAAELQEHYPGCELVLGRDLRLMILEPPNGSPVGDVSIETGQIYWYHEAEL